MKTMKKLQITKKLIVNGGFERGRVVLNAARGVLNAAEGGFERGGGGFERGNGGLFRFY